MYQSSLTHRATHAAGPTTFSLGHSTFGCAYSLFKARAVLVWIVLSLTCVPSCPFAPFPHSIKNLNHGYMPLKCENCWTPEGLHIPASGSYKSTRGMLSNPDSLGTRRRCQMTQMSGSLLRLCFFHWQISLPLKAENEACKSSKNLHHLFYEKQNCTLLCEVPLSSLPATVRILGNLIHYWIWAPKVKIAL